MRTKPCLTSSDVLKMAAACKAEAESNKWSVTFVIVDDAGVPLHLERMDGVSGMGVDVAIGKARTSAMSRRPSKFWEDRVKERVGFLNFPGLIPVQGGLPILIQGECLGGIGVSGVQSHEDEQIAQAGLDAIAGSLSAAS